MTSLRTIRSLKRDLEQLRAALGDFKKGGGNFASDRERESIIAGLERRLDDVIAAIKKIEET